MTATIHLKAENSNPAVGVAAVTPNDSADLPAGPCRSLYVGGLGDVAIVAVDGTTAVFVAVLAGTILPVCTKRVLVTDTSATDIVALY